MKCHLLKKKWITCYSIFSQIKQKDLGKHAWLCNSTHEILNEPCICHILFNLFFIFFGFFLRFRINSFNDLKIYNFLILTWYCFNKISEQFLFGLSWIFLFVYLLKFNFFSFSLCMFFYYLMITLKIDSKKIQCIILIFLIHVWHGYENIIFY
jgi:hypothetical protein